jgi:hypothetical protein
MTQVAEIVDRHAVARRLFDALCVQYPDKYIALIQPPDVASDPLPAPEIGDTKGSGVAIEADHSIAARSSRS